MKQLLLNNGGQVVAIDGNVNIGHFVFGGGEVGAQGETIGITQVQQLTVRSGGTRYLRRTRIVVSDLFSVDGGSLQLDANSSLVFLTSARALISGLQASITSEGNAPGASLENKGTLQVVMSDLRSAIFVGVHVINTGTVHVVNGRIRLAAGSNLEGSVIVETNGVVEFIQNEHIVAPSNFSSSGVIRTTDSIEFRTSLQVRLTQGFVHTVVADGGNVVLSSAFCFDTFHITNGIVNVLESVGVNRFILAGGTLSSSSRLDVNGAATWSDGSITSGLVAFNGAVNVSPGLHGTALITNVGTKQPLLLRSVIY